MYLFAGAVMLLGIGITSAQQPVTQRTVTTTHDSAPWHLAKVSKLSRARGTQEEAAPKNASRPYLHIDVAFNVPEKARKEHTFRITDRNGKEVGELWGWNDSRSLVIFEGNWGDLTGLWLEGNGHREPLFTLKPAVATTVQSPTIQSPTIQSQPVRPRPTVIARNPRTYVADQPSTTTYIHDGGTRFVGPTVHVPATTTHVVSPERVVYHDGVDRVVTHVADHDVIDRGDRVIHVGGGHRVIHEGGDTTIVHHDGGETHHVYVDDGGDTTVVHHTGGDTEHVYVDDGAGDGDAASDGGQGSGLGSGSGSGDGPGAGPGEGPGAGAGEDCAKGPGEGACEGSGSRNGPGPGEGPGMGPGSGDGPGCAKGPGEGSGSRNGPGPGEGPGMGPGSGDGPGCAKGPGEGSGSRNGPGMGGGPGMGPGSGGGPCEGSGSRNGPGQFANLPGRGPGRYGPMASNAIKGPANTRDVLPAFVLYVSTGDETGPGKVYQVDENGRVLGVVKLPFTATGMALHRTHGLVLALPRDGGRIMRIDDTAKVSTLLEKDKTLVHPVDVAISGESDSVLVADNIADLMAATTSAGIKPRLYQRFDGQQWTAQNMSVAITNDKHVIFGTDGDPGIYRFSGDSQSAAADPLLPGPGGVAADPKSLRWAATQAPDQIYVFEGEELVKKLRLPSDKRMYRNGLLSFSPAGSLCVAVRDSDKTVGEPWFLMYDIEKDEIRSLFPWTRETMTDFVVGPRMFWDRNSPSTYKSTH